LNSNNARAGNITLVNRQQTQLSSINGRPQYLKQTSGGTMAGQAQSASWQFDWTAPAEDIGRVTLYYCGNAANSDGGTNGDRIYGAESSLIAVEPPPPPDEVTVRLHPGWNLVSSRVAPGDLALPALFGALVEAGSLRIVRNAMGEAYIPADEQNDIGDWDTLQAYQIKVTENAEVTFVGAYIDPGITYNLADGWNWISYPREDTLHPATLLATLGGAAVQVKDGKGGVSLSALQVSSLHPVMPGDGVMIQMAVEEPFEFVWPEPDRELEPPFPPAMPRHFNPALPTGGWMSLAVTEWNIFGAVGEGDEIGVMAGETTIGAGVVHEGILLMNAWADDPTTGVRDGAVQGDSLVFIYWNAAADSEVTLTARETMMDRPLTFAENDWMSIAVTSPEPNKITEPGFNSPVQFSVDGFFPTPFNGRGFASFRLPASGFASVALYDLSGREVVPTVVSQLQAGLNQVAINAEGLPGGLYLAGVTFEGAQKFTKVLLVR
jgi:hypothetical protein